MTKNKNQPCDIIAAIAFIYWNGKALIAKRSDQEDFLPGYWELIGGQVKAGESVEQAFTWISVDELKDIKPMTDKMRDRIAKGFYELCLRIPKKKYSR